MKEVADIYSPILIQIWSNKIINSKSFHANLKLADVTPVFLKIDTTLVENYRPVSVLPIAPNVFEKLMQKQLNNYISKLLSLFLCGYRKGYGAHFSLMSSIQKWKFCLDQKRYTGTVLMNLSKSFDTINHELLIAKLHTYSFCKDSLEIILSY